MRPDQDAVIDLMNNVFNESRFKIALQTIANMPLPEQDDMISANMRKIAQEALNH